MVKIILPGGDRQLIHSDPTDVWLGSDPGSYLISSMANIDLIVNLADRGGPATLLHAVVMHYSMVDSWGDHDTPERERCERFLDAVHHFASTGSSLWHCQAGVNRSAFMLASYLHLHRGLPIREAIALLRAKRGEVILSNKTFEKRLLERYG